VKPGRVLLAAVLCGWAVMMLVDAGSAEAQPVPASLMEPLTDAGVWMAGPRQLGAACYTCPTPRTKAVTVCNPSDTDQNPTGASVRVGGSRVRAWPVAKKNGLPLAAGACVSLPLGGSGQVCVVSDSTTDAGSALGALCSEGGP
jgi:hypothetical protein